MSLNPTPAPTPRENRLVWMSVENKPVAEAPDVQKEETDKKKPYQLKNPGIKTARTAAEEASKKTDAATEDKLLKELDAAYREAEIGTQVKNPEQKQKLAELIKKLEKDKSQASLLDLHNLATDKNGRETMRKQFAPGEVAEGQSIDVDFGNDAAEWNIGAGDILPPTVQQITVDIKYPDKRTETRSGTRKTSPRPGYYDAKGYIPIFTGSQITVDKVIPESEVQQVDLAAEKTFHASRVEETKKEQADLEAFLKEHDIPGLEDMENLDAQKLKTAFQAMGGREVWLTRKRLGARKLKHIFEASGLSNERVSVEDIVKDDPEIKAVMDKLPPDMVRKIMQIESANHAFAVSPTGALGCMQLTKWIYHDISPPINPFNPGEAVKRAAEHLLDVYQETGSVEKTVRTYNGGYKYASNAGADRNYFKKYQAA